MAPGRPKAQLVVGSEGGMLERRRKAAQARSGLSQTAVRLSGVSSNAGNLRAYGLALLTVGFAILVSATVPALQERTPYLPVLGAVIVASSYGGLWPGLFATFVGGVLTDYLLVPPIYHAVGSPGDLQRLAVLFVLGVFTSLRSVEMKRNAADREERLGAEAANHAKDELLAMISHELRSPLAVIRMWATLLRTRKLGEAESASGLKAIEDSAILQTRLVADLLDVSRIASGKLGLNHHAVDLAAATRAALETVRTAAEERRIYVIEAIDAAVGFVWGDEVRLQQIVWNLLSNAIKFTADGGRVVIRLERYGDEARLTVRDTGEGITPDLLPHIFERFRQGETSTARRHGGLGLGLAIVHHLVDAHGGRIEARSRGRGEGATFIVTLPLAVHLRMQRDAVQPAQKEDVTNGGVLDGLRVLVVEDDPRAREVIAMVLERSGADVRPVDSAAAAVSALKQDRIDVLLTDIAMPGEDGYALLEHLRTSGVDLPAAALTGFAAEEHRRRAFSLGFEAYLTKPVHPAQLVETIATLATSPLD